jgi:type II pantothenate kinase
MKYRIGIDIGSSTTKLVVIDENQTVLLQKMVNNQTAENATIQCKQLEQFLQEIFSEHKLSVSDIQKIALTGVGTSNLMNRIILGLPTIPVKEFEAIGAGGLFLSGLEDGIVMNIGTGTAFVKATPDAFIHLGGSGVGGGTLIGLSNSLTRLTDIDIINSLANSGDLKNVDLHMWDISHEAASQLPDYVTACNFGKVSSNVQHGDILLGIMNMIYQTVGTMAVFLSKNEGMNQIIVTGSTATLPQAKVLLGRVGELYGVDFLIQEHSSFASAIGAAIVC